MVNFTEPVDPSQFATATEVDGLRRTLDEFMKNQDDVNQSIKSSLDKILSQFTINPQMGVPAPEDKGSNIKGKEQVAPPPQFQFPHPHNSNWPRHPQHQHHYKHPSQFVPIHHDEHSYYGMHQQPSHVHWSAQGQFVASDDYGEEEYEYEQDYQEHPAPFHEQDKSLFQPKRAPNFNQQKATTPPQNKPPPPPYQPHNTQPHIQTTHTENRQEKLPTTTQTNYVMQLQNQHRAVARGPKLTFPEFAGEDTDGWIRKAEKYFELVGVPTEDRVKIAVLYITGKAEFWWRGTGCNANTLPWHHFCRMVTDRFNLVSEYEVIGQFHNLKQVGTVVDYVDRFEEMVTMVRGIAHNFLKPITSAASYLASRIPSNITCNVIDLQPYHKLIGMPNVWNKPIPLSRNPMFLINLQKYRNSGPKTRTQPLLLWQNSKLLVNVLNAGNLGYLDTQKYVRVNNSILSS